MATVKLKVVQAHNAYMRLREKLAGWLTKPTLADGKINKEENDKKKWMGKHYSSEITVDIHKQKYREEKRYDEKSVTTNDCSICTITTTTTIFTLLFGFHSAINKYLSHQQHLGIYLHQIYFHLFSTPNQWNEKEEKFVLFFVKVCKTLQIFKGVWVGLCLWIDDNDTHTHISSLATY